MDHTYKALRNLVGLRLLRAQHQRAFVGGEVVEGKDQFVNPGFQRLGGVPVEAMTYQAAD